MLLHLRVDGIRIQHRSLDELALAGRINPRGARGFLRLGLPGSRDTKRGGEDHVSSSKVQIWEALLQEAFEDLASLQRFLHGHLLRTPAGQEVWTSLPVIPESLANLAAEAAQTLEAEKLLNVDLAKSLVAVRPQSWARMLAVLHEHLTRVETQQLRAMANDRRGELDQLKAPDPRWLDTIRGALHVAAERMKTDAFLHRLRKTTQVQEADLLTRSQRYFSERLRRIAPRLFAEQAEMQPPLAAFYESALVGLGTGALSERLAAAITRWSVENMAIADQLRALETASGLPSGSWSVGGLERETSEFVRETIEPRIRPAALEISLRAAVSRIESLESELRTAQSERAPAGQDRNTPPDDQAELVERLEALERQAAMSPRNAVPFLLMGVVVLVLAAILYGAVSSEIALNQRELEALHEALPSR